MQKISRQNEKATSVIRQKFEQIVKRLKQLKKIEERDFSENETDSLIAQIERLEQEDDFIPGPILFDEVKEESDFDSILSFDEQTNCTKIGKIEIE